MMKASDCAREQCWREANEIESPKNRKGNPISHFVTLLSSPLGGLDVPVEMSRPFLIYET